MVSNRYMNMKSHFCRMKKYVWTLVGMAALLVGGAGAEEPEGVEMVMEGEVVAAVRRCLPLPDGGQGCVQINVVRQGKRFLACFQDVSSDAVSGLPEVRAYLWAAPRSVAAGEIAFPSPRDFLTTAVDERGMGLYVAEVGDEVCMLDYVVSSGDWESGQQVSGNIYLTLPTGDAVAERPGCWGSAELKEAPELPAEGLPAPAEESCVSRLVVDVPAAEEGGEQGRLRVSVYRQEGGFLIETEDLTRPEAPLCISDMSLGNGQMANGFAQVVIGPSYNGEFKPLHTVRRGIGLFWLADESVAKYHAGCVAVTLSFRVCDAEGRALASFSTELDLPASVGDEPASAR